MKSQEGQNAKESKSKKTKDSKVLIAGKNLATLVPPVTRLNRMGIHKPAVAVPASVHGAKDVVAIANIKNIRVSISEQYSFLAMPLFLH